MVESLLWHYQLWRKKEKTRSLGIINQLKDTEGIQETEAETEVAKDAKLTSQEIVRNTRQMLANTAAEVDLVRSTRRENIHRAPIKKSRANIEKTVRLPTRDTLPMRRKSTRKRPKKANTNAIDLSAMSDLLSVF